MTIRTINLDDVLSRTTNVYEAVLVIAKRAKAITTERKSQEALLTHADFETTEIADEIEIEETKEEEKALKIAMKDFFNNKLEINYRVLEESINNSLENIIEDRIEANAETTKTIPAKE